MGQRKALLDTLKTRFASHTTRHKGIRWTEVQARLEARPDKLRSLAEMERTGGEPDVVGQDKTSNEYIFCDVRSVSRSSVRAGRVLRKR